MKKTIRQISEDLQTNKQVIYRIIKNNNISEIPNEKGKIKYYDEISVRLITLIYESKNQESHHKSRQNNNNKNAENPLFITNSKNEVYHEVLHDETLEIIDLLKNELKLKNKQIDQLNDRLSETTSALLAAQQSLQASQALHAGTIKNQLDDKSDNPQSVVTATEPVKKKKWFKFR